MTEINVEIIGQGEPLILLHGWGWHSGIWQPIVPYLADKFTLFLVDLPGFGKSEAISPPYSFEAIYKAISPSLPPKATWLGWSLGGMLAWWVAINYPNKVSKLITLASNPKFVAGDNWPGISLVTLDKFYQSLSQHFIQTLEDFLTLQLRGSADHQALFIELKKQLVTMPKAALPVLQGGLRLLEETDLRADLSKINCPSLHIFGQYDTLIPVSVVPKINGLLPNAQFVIIPKAGHIPFLTQTQVFLDAIMSL